MIDGSLIGPARSFVRSLQRAHASGLLTQAPGHFPMTRAILLALLLAGCGSDPGEQPPKPAIYSEAWYALPRCTIQPAAACAPGLAELQCDRALTTLEQDCANLLTGTALCSAQVDALPAGDCEPVGDGATWCCKCR